MAHRRPRRHDPNPGKFQRSGWPSFGEHVRLSNKEIGRRLNITDGTIKVHLHHIFQKLEISNRTVLAALAIAYDERAGFFKDKPAVPGYAKAALYLQALKGC